MAVNTDITNLVPYLQVKFLQHIRRLSACSSNEWQGLDPTRQGTRILILAMDNRGVCPIIMWPTLFLRRNSCSGMRSSSVLAFLLGGPSSSPMGGRGGMPTGPAPGGPAIPGGPIPGGMKPPGGPIPIGGGPMWGGPDMGPRGGIPVEGEEMKSIH